MILGIDASNIRYGGGLNHLRLILTAGTPEAHGFSKVIVWGGEKATRTLPDKPWLERVHEPLLDGPLPARVYWLKTRLSKLAAEQCDVLFVPGGVYTGPFRPFVTMSQNLLPFDYPERQRYGLSWNHLRYRILEVNQRNTFQKAAGVIFLTKSAQEIVEDRTGRLKGKTAVIPHGIEPRFFHPPKPQRPYAEFSKEQPFRWLYVSIVKPYKHQWLVAEAVARLREDGLPVTLNLVGPAYEPSLKRLREALERLDPQGEFLHYAGPVPFEELSARYKEADGFVFASTCETFGQILLEAMAAGVPIASSNRTAMPEILEDAGVYFNPEDVQEMMTTMRTLMKDQNLRTRLAEGAYTYATAYAWERCADETFAFIAQAVA